MNTKLLFPGWLLVSVILLLYSFTQIDLNLTLSQFSIWQVIEKQFQYVGYFMRPFSTGLYFIIVSVMFGLYILTLKLVSDNMLKRSDVWKIILGLCAILFFSYNAFSYDLFNYIFDARIVTYYHENPYQHKPLDFYPDSHLNFMRSTHRTYPYGPVWLGLTVPLTFVGSDFFLLTFFLFKLLMVVSFVGAVYFLEKVLNEYMSKKSLFGLTFFALNPLVIIESLVSAHNDIVMIFFAILGLYLINKKYILSTSVLLISIGIKFATVFLTPIYILIAALKMMKTKIDMNRLLFFSAFLMMLSTIAITFSSGTNKDPEPQPWYLINLIPFVSLISNSRSVQVVTICISFGMLLFYVPFLYTGEWPKNIVEIKIWILVISIFIAFIIRARFAKYLSSFV